jgi:glutaminyl-tRNA synthetase
LIFNKTVGLRDTWAKKEPKETQSTKQQPVPQASKRKAIDVIKQLGKKYTNLPEAKQQKVKVEIKTLANDVSYEDLEPLFNTAAKKVGTRIAVALTLKVLLDNGLEKNDSIYTFIATAKTDAHPLLSDLAVQI